MKLLKRKIINIEELKNHTQFDQFNHLMPSINELSEFAKLKDQKILAYQILNNDKKILALAIFIIERRSLSGVRLNTFSILGHDYFDYNFFYCQKDLLNEFLSYISSDAKNYAIDLIIFENTIFPDKIHKKIKKEDVYIFDSRIYAYAEPKFNTIIKKKSLIRHSNKMKKELNHFCIHKEATFTKDDLTTLAILHKERWGFDNIASGFNNKERIDTYLSHKNNKVLTIIRNHDEIIAMHYGMILGNVFLWHTPTINIKFLDYSPIEVLLFEIARFCQENDLDIIDFGLGDEKYKERFSNAKRFIYHKLIPLSIKGKLCFFITNYLNTNKIKNNLVNAKKEITKIVRRILTLKTKISYYTFVKSNLNAQVSINQDDYELRVIDKFMDLVQLFRNSHILIKRYHYNRLKSGCILLCLVKNNEVLSYGWATQESKFFVSEINKNICNKEKIMLFDFITLEHLRGKGYYTLLLEKISLSFQEKLAIFATTNNIASNKAIVRSGFVKDIYVTI